MKTFKAAIKIQASPQDVWDVLVDASHYPEWDPGMDHVEGRIAPGEKVKFFTKFNPNQAFAVNVTTFEPGRKLVLTGGLPLGLFKSERTHLLTPDGNGEISFTTEETFSGLLFPIFGKKIPDLTESFNNFATGLKMQAERKG